jgi:hypothetical protein
MKSIKRTAQRVAVAAVASGLLTAGAATLAGAASASTLSPSYAGHYHFQTIDNPKDLTFNQLLGINDEDQIVGYFGSGAAGHPNKGYRIPPFSRTFIDENFPGSVQTQVTGENNRGVTVGFWSSMNNANMMNDNHGFVDVDGHFRTADFPTATPATPPVDQLLGVNDQDVAVGFWTDNAGNNHGYEYNVNSSSYSSVVDPNLKGASLIAAAINDRGDVAGVYTNGAGATHGYLLSHGQFTDLSVPGSTSTMALGVNNSDEVVGVFVPSSDANALEGFTWTPQHGFTVVNDPKGVNGGNLTTTINGVNDFGQVVGFYVDANGNTDGFLATP